MQRPEGRYNIVAVQLVVGRRDDQIEPIDADSRVLQLNCDDSILLPPFDGERGRDSLSASGDEKVGPRWRQTIARWTGCAERREPELRWQDRPGESRRYAQNLRRQIQRLHQTQALAFHPLLAICQDPAMSRARHRLSLCNGFRVHH